MSNHNVLLDVQGLSVSFGGKRVVHGIDFQIAPGEKLALVGESGSGKTVSALSILRLAGDARLQGRVVFEGQRDLLKLSERELRGMRGGEIAMIFQEPMTALNPLMTIGEQIAEVLRSKGTGAGPDLAAAVVELLASTGIPEPARRATAYPHQLSGGQRQRAMIAMALACRPKLLLADEPTTALDVTLRSQILQLLAELQHKTGMAVLLITHDLNLVRRFADRIAVMEQGVIVETGTVRDVFAAPRHPYTRKLLSSTPERNVQELSELPGGEPPLMQARHLTVGYPVSLPGLRGWFRRGEFIAVQAADFEIAPGQTFGVIGESGSGKSTLAQAALGLLSHRGELTVAGRGWTKSPTANRPLRRIVQVVFQDPFSSLSPRFTIGEIVSEGLRVHAPTLSEAERQQQVIRALDDVGLQESNFPRLLERYPHEFSGGQRQRIAIARALIVNPSLLVLDEPTSALDVTIQQQVLRLLQRLQRERRLSYLLITHDVAVIRAMAHHVMVMKDGRVVEHGTLAQVLDAPRDPYTRELVAAALDPPD